ncbi:xenobiotic compound monooxygenase, DszA family [Xylona heveae TC161]|uniref:Xenobiotic compound monooxygenase, DszA family n=1 Tax=Xylona heveae (strain CBS 132557 / TC161) TaxID=1328760 RepID=A0A164ZC89_XYLHT|nr:xenobiotic compound monooxygenase, DszA family [Xylona heveae TC161]KZF18924.1 xenobiotic compound monooxygenase, DszA family [Xylona heveae TC161]
MASSENVNSQIPKKRIFLNAFDMSTVGHLSPGQWKDPEDRSATKRRLDYWINLAKILERGDINALFLADTYGGYDTYQDSLDPCIRTAAQWPVTDPTIPISAMAAVTKNLAFGITASTSFEPPFLLAKRFSTLDHLTNGRVGWNIVTSWKKAAFKAIGLDEPIEHDQRYAQADEYLRVVYKLWQGSWADDAVVADESSDTYTDPEKVRTIKHDGQFYHLESRHIVDPSPQRTPFLFQAGTSPAGSQFGATHAEAIFVTGHSPSVLAPRVARIRQLASEVGRDPSSIKFFATFTPILGRTEEEAQERFERAKKYASITGGLVLFSGWTGIDISKVPLDEEIDPVKHSLEVHKVRSTVETLTARTVEVPSLTPRTIASIAAIGGLGPVAVGTPEKVSDQLERWVNEAGIDGFNLGYVTTPGTFEQVVDLLIPELRRRGLYPEKSSEGAAPLTAREKIYGEGQNQLRDDHPGSKYKYDVYQEEASAN